MNLRILLLWCTFLSQIMTHDCTGCAPYRNVPHGTLHYDRDARDDGTYPHDTLVNITCDEGYVVSHPASHMNPPKCGRYFTGKWYWHSMRCIVACPNLTIRNAQRVTYRPPIIALEHNDKNWIYPLTIADIFCPDGFVQFPPVGNSKCQQSGIWDPPPPDCSGLCPFLNLPNGTVSYDESNYRLGSRSGRTYVGFPANTTATFTCNNGYPEPNVSINCTISDQYPGNWSQQIPRCLRSCPSLRLPNGQVDYDSDPPVDGQYPVNTTARFQCNDGYTLPVHSSYYLSQRSTCQASGSWNINPTCIVTCPALSLSSGRISFSRQPVDGRYPVGTEVFVFCDWQSGYRLTGSQRRKCQASGNWDGNVAACHLISCPALTLINGRVSYNKDSVDGGYPVTTEVHYSCNYGYRLSGPPKRYCQSSDDWTGPVAVCNPVPTCSTLRLNNGKVSYNKEPINGRYPMFTYAQFKCNKGYYPAEGPGGAVCQSTEIWNQQLPTCNKYGCFPSMAKVKLENGMSVTMSELQIGSRVQTVSSTGSVRYNEVTTFMHKDPKIIINYKSVTTLSNQTLTLSGNHLVYAQKHNSSRFIPMYAGEVSVGDAVLVQENYGLVPTKVIKVSNLMTQGIYVPLTAEGNIIVDGVLSSCYASFDHDLAHIGMKPIQWLPKIIHWIFGEEDGLETYVGTTKQLGRLILPHGSLWN